RAPSPRPDRARTRAPSPARDPWRRHGPPGRPARPWSPASRGRSRRTARREWRPGQLPEARLKVFQASRAGRRPMLAAFATMRPWCGRAEVPAGLSSVYDFFRPEGIHADCQPTDSQGPRDQAREDEDARAPGRPAEAGGLHPRLDDDAQEAELGAA